MVVGDFTGDGRLDIAVANHDSNTVGVLLGNGNGGFTPAVTYATGGSGPTSIVAGDFNGDGKLDLAVTNADSNTVGLLLGNGAGGFAAATTFASGGSSPVALAVGDFNGDGKLDLAVANQASNTVGVLLGNGAGGFATATTFASRGSPDAVAVGDFNGDGKLDIAVANASNVGLLVGNGSGGFSAATTFSSGGSDPAALVVGDFNGDGKLDLAVANYASGTVGLLLGTGAGGFATVTTVSSGGTDPTALVAGDFNGDGKLDLAVANAGSNTAAVLLGNGAGGFDAAATIASGGSDPYSVAVGDFNGDGKPDLAVANYISSTVSVFLGNGTGGFSAPTTFSSGGTNPQSIVVGDFNDDGKLDIAVANYGNNTVSVFLGNGAGGFSAATTYASGGSHPEALVAGDFNGQEDLVVANYSSGTVGVLLGNGSGGFAAATTYACGSTPDALAVGDFNGREDLAVANYSSGTVSVLLGNGTGGFAAATPFASGGSHPEAVAVGDFNGDGTPDLAVANGGSNTVAVLSGKGAGAFAPATTFASGGTNPYALAVADFNGDGQSDLAVANRNSGTVGLLLGNGAGGFAAVATSSSGGVLPSSLAVGDFNGDGNLDLAVVNYNGSTLGVLLNTAYSAPAAPDFRRRHDLPGPDRRIRRRATRRGIHRRLQWRGPPADRRPGLHATLGNRRSHQRQRHRGHAHGEHGRTACLPRGYRAGQRQPGFRPHRRQLPKSHGQRHHHHGDRPRQPGPQCGRHGLRHLRRHGRGQSQRPVDRHRQRQRRTAVIYYLHGPYGLTPSSVQVIGDNLTWTYSITVPAGQKIELAYYAITAASPAAAVSAAGALVTSAGFAGHAADGLAASDLGTLMNFAFQPLPVLAFQAGSGAGTYGGAASLTVTLASGGQPLPNEALSFAFDGTPLGTATTDANGNATLANISLAELDAGTYADYLTVNFAGNATYVVSNAAMDLTVNPAPLTITAVAASMVYGASLPPLTYITSGLLGSDTLTVPPTLATTATAASHAGNYPVTVAGTAASADYTISYVSGTLTVTPAALTVTADNQSMVYGAALPTLTASYVGFVNGDTLASLGTPPTLATTATNGSDVSGSPYAITAGGAVDPDYTFSYVTGVLTVTPAPLTVVVDNLSKVYGQANPDLTGTLSGVVAGDGITASYSTAAGQFSDVGDYPITATLNDPNNLLSNYSVTVTDGALSVTPADQTITWSDPAAIVYGTPLGDGQLNATVAGVVGGAAAAAQLRSVGRHVAGGRPPAAVDGHGRRHHGLSPGHGDRLPRCGLGRRLVRRATEPCGARRPTGVARPRSPMSPWFSRARPV